MIHKEAARRLGWSGADSGQLELHGEEHRKMPRGSCACTIANQLVSREFLSTVPFDRLQFNSVEGRFEQLHCPCEIDGSFCTNEKCTYSHSRIGVYFSSNDQCYVLGCSTSLGSGKLGPLKDIKCRICTELFGTHYPVYETLAHLLTNLAGFPCEKCMKNSQKEKHDCPLVQVWLDPLHRRHQEIEFPFCLPKNPECRVCLLR